MTRSSFDYEEKKGRVRVFKQNAPNIGPGSKGGSNQVVVKVVGYGKSGRSAAAMIKYITENSEHVSEPIGVTTSEGATVSQAEALNNLKDWGLMSDRENMTEAVRGMTPKERGQMTENDRLANRQVVHMIFSFPKDASRRLSETQMTEIAKDVLAPYQEAGFRFVLANHVEKEHRHVHVVMNTKTTMGQRLRIQPRDIQEMRERMVEAARQHAGLSLDAKPSQRWEHRAELEMDRLLSMAATGQLTVKDKIALDELRGKLNQGMGVERAALTGQLTPKQVKQIKADINQLEKKMIKIDGKPVLAGWAVEAIEKKRNLLDQNDAGKRMSVGEKQAAIEAFEKSSWRGRRIEKIDRIRSMNAQVVNAARGGRKPTMWERFKQASTGKPAIKEEDLLKAAKELNIQLEGQAPKVVSAALSQHAPLWTARYGIEVALTKTGATPRVLPPKAPDLNVPEMWEPARLAMTDTFGRIYKNPDQARERYIEMLAEKPGTAKWFLQKQPQVFGEVKDPKADVSQVVRLWIDPAWTKQARAVIETAAYAPDQGQQARMKMVADLQAAADKPFRYSSAEQPRLEPERTVVRPQEQSQPPTQEVKAETPAQQAQPERRSQETPIMRMAPMWYTRHGLGYEARRSGHEVPSEAQARALPIRIALPPELDQKTAAWFQRHYVNSETAKTRFIEMAAENVRGAFWHLARTPAAFGEMKAEKEPERVNQREWQFPREALEEIKKAMADNHTENSQIKAMAQELRSQPTRPELRYDPNPLHHQAPTWYERHGAEWESRRTGLTPDLVAPVPTVANVNALQDAQARTIILKEFAKAYVSVAETAGKFLEMYAENPTVALKTLTANPAVFGPTKPDARPNIPADAMQIGKEQSRGIVTRMKQALADDPQRDARNKQARTMRLVQTTLKGAEKLQQDRRHNAHHHGHGVNR